jgi:hypothetical protein
MKQALPVDRSYALFPSDGHLDSRRRYLRQIEVHEHLDSETR